MNLPTLSPDWIDGVIVVFLITYVAFRIRRGFIDATFDLLGFLFSMIMATQLFDNASDLIRRFLEIPPGIGNAAGFFAVATVTEILFSIIAIFILRLIPHFIHNSLLNRALGVIPSFLSGLILTLFFLVAVIALPVRPDLKHSVLNSRIGSTLAQNTFGIETNINDVFGGAVEEALQFLTVKPESNETVNLNFSTTEFTVDPQAEAEMLVLVNKERTSRGLKALAPDEPERAVARAHCEDMFRRGYFSHYTPEGLSPFDRMQNAGIIYKTAGENLAYAPTVETAHEGLMNSPGHRANILSPDFGRVGIGVIDAGVYGSMFCQNFRD